MVRCGLIRPGSGVTIYVSKNGSSVLVTGLFRRLGERGGFPFRLIFLMVSPNCDIRGHSMVRDGTHELGVPVAIFRASVFGSICGISGCPYCLYTEVEENCLCGGTGRLNYGGVTLNRRCSSIVRAVLVNVLCNNRIRAVVPGLRDAGCRKVRLVHPLCLIHRTRVGR